MPTTAVTPQPWPSALDNARKTLPELDYIDDPIAAVQDTDLLLHFTECSRTAAPVRR
ncbi:hypothetical protein ACVWZD_006496 [Streptomyces sp. TE3672]